MYFLSVDRSCVKLFRFSTVLLSIKFLKIGFIVVQWENENSASVVKEKGKISAQPHPTLCIQFLDRENNNKNNTLLLGKEICFTIIWGYAEILPRKESRWRRGVKRRDNS